MGGGYTKQKVKDMGNQEFKRGNFKKAAQYYSLVLRSDKANHLLLSNRCLCYIKLGKLALAYEDALAVLRLRRDFVKGHYRLGLIFEALGLLYDAFHTLRKASCLDPASKELSAKLADVRKQMQEQYTHKGRPSVLVWGNNQGHGAGIKG